LGFAYREETDNPAYQLFAGAGKIGFIPRSETPSPALDPVQRQRGYD